MSKTVDIPQPEQVLTLTLEQVRELRSGITSGERVEVCMRNTPNGKLYYLSAGPMEATIPVGNFEPPDDAPRENLEAIVALPGILTDLHTTKTELSKSQSAYARLWEGLHDVRERCERGENCTPALLIEFIDEIQQREIPNADEVL